MLNYDDELSPVEIPPHSSEAEQAVLCGVLHYPALISHVVGILQPEHFYRSAHQEIFRAMLTCFEQQIPIEPVAVGEALRSAGTLPQAGGLPYLYDLMIGANPNARVLDDYSLKYWTKILIELAKRREVMKLALEIRESAADPSQKHYLEEAENLLYIISETYNTEQEQAANALDEAIEQIEDELSRPNGVTGLSTGFSTLDNSTHGFQPWQLITVSARPGGGKSTFALNVMSHVVL